MKKSSCSLSGFGGLVVSMLASGPNFGFQTRPKLSDFSGVKILRMPSFGALQHFKEPSNFVEVAKFYRPFLAHTSSFR
jgi:hypothetical protein